MTTDVVEAPAMTHSPIPRSFWIGVVVCHAFSAIAGMPSLLGNPVMGDETTSWDIVMTFWVIGTFIVFPTVELTLGLIYMIHRQRLNRVV
ncbi:MAG: hypothetical protein QM754_07485 [Tepidisphaeraceae bacterium]